MVTTEPNCYSLDSERIKAHVFNIRRLLQRSGVRANQTKIRAALPAFKSVAKGLHVNLELSKDDPFVDLEDGLTLAHAIVDTVRDPLVVLDHDLRVIAASRSFYQTFRLVREDVRGDLLYEIDGGQWDIPELRELLGSISSGQASVEGYEVDREFPAIGHRVMLLNARKVFYEKGTHSTVLLAFEDITARRAIERQVEELLREKDMLLEEMQHRVANSLQIIASILLIKARTVQSEETRLQLEDAHQRVLSVAAVQQHLHVDGGGKPIEIGKYLTKLCETLAQSMIGGSRPISLKVDADAGTAPSRDAVSIGLVVTELVMNALKHAFPAERSGAAIVVSYKVAGPDWKLAVTDNGIGKPAVNASATKPGLGTSLVKALTRQLDAVVDIVSGPARHGRIRHARDIQIRTDAESNSAARLRCSDVAAVAISGQAGEYGDQFSKSQPQLRRDAAGGSFLGTRPLDREFVLRDRGSARAVPAERAPRRGRPAAGIRQQPRPYLRDRRQGLRARPPRLLTISNIADF